jgi:hypothetical protein
MQIRVAGTGQAASASMAADAFVVIFWILPQPSRGESAVRSGAAPELQFANIQARSRKL